MALTRLDLTWAFGAPAMHEFTEHYRALSDLDWTCLPHWELCIALRDGHRQFVQQALASLER